MRKAKPTYHDAEESFFLDIPLVIFVDLDDLLKCCTDRNEKASGLGQLVDQLLRDRRGSRSNVNAVVRTSSDMAYGRE
jgi:hypothetical protein